MSAKSEILERIRTALTDVGDVSAVDDVPVPWEFGQAVNLPGNGDILDVFVEAVEDYKAVVVRCSANDLPREIAIGLRATGAHGVIVPDGLKPEWLVAAEDMVFTREEGKPLSAQELNRIDAVVTAAAVGVAETGTIVLDHSPDQGRRALSLVPDRHICVVRADQVVSGVPEAVALLRPAVEAGQPLTWISGGSATSDIELSRVEGVHGPRQLYVILVQEGL
ncbi:MAG: LutC/YkgG family protein [Arachnia sp.]